jgi:hypothetical protein
MDCKKITCSNGILSSDSPIQVGSTVAVYYEGKLTNGIIEKFGVVQIRVTESGEAWKR